MSITDELREYASTRITPNKGQLEAIADRIDAEHEKATSEFWTKINAVPVTDENMAEYGWIRLPKDADGEYIHIGERVQLIGNDPSTVSHMSLADYGWRVHVKYDGVIGTGSCEPKRIRHYHAPTVEDVLREFAGDIAEVLGGDDFKLDNHDELYNEYAAKLRLAGEDE